VKRTSNQAACLVEVGADGVYEPLHKRQRLASRCSEFGLLLVAKVSDADDGRGVVVHSTRQLEGTVKS
jgi:hypothetical protein